MFFISNIISFAGRLRDYKNPEEWKNESKRLLWRCGRSLAFLAGYGFCGKFSLCVLWPLFDNTKLIPKIYTLIASICIFLENNDRWKEMALYITPKLLESFPAYFKKQKSTIGFPMSGSLMLALSIGIFSCLYNRRVKKK